MSDRLTRTMPVGLGIDSSAAACSAAVVDGSGVLAREYLPLARGHAEVLLPMIRRVMAEAGRTFADLGAVARSEEHTSELQSLMRTSYAVFCLKKKKQ